MLISFIKIVKWQMRISQDMQLILVWKCTFIVIYLWYISFLIIIFTQIEKYLYSKIIHYEYYNYIKKEI